MKARRQTSKPAAIPAKISVPRLAETYPRSRLFRTIDSARKKRVVWVAAPAGAGKTSMIATYVSARRVPALWYNVDSRDTDVAYLFHYLALAARGASRKKKLDLPEFTADSQAGVAAFARSFFEALCRERPVPSLLVLDDYHEATSQLWDDVIREAISALPKGIVAVIVSRTEPPPTFARLVASGEIGLVGWDDLRLTPRETTGLARLCRPDWRGRKLERALPGVAALANGWAAALMLLLQNQQVDAIDTGDVEELSEPLFDYFATEILDKTTPAQRAFLLRTSIVPSLTTALAARLMGTTDAARTLTELGRRSFLTQRLGASGAYRYHPLLRGFLRRRAERDLGEETLHELHRKAADYFVETDQIDEAMEQLETAPDVPVRIKLLLRVAPLYFFKGRGRTVEAWIARLPPEVVENGSWLLHWQALCCLGYAPTRARDLLERAFVLFERENDAAGLYQSCAIAMQAIIHEGMNFAELNPWIERFERLEASGPPCPLPIQPMAVTGMMMAQMFGREYPTHRYWVDRAMRLSATCEDVGQRILTGGFLAIHFIFNDYPAQAATLIEMLRASSRGASSALGSLTLLNAEAICVWARGDVTTCLALVREALALAAKSGVFVWNDYLLGLGATATLGSEDIDGAREFIQGLAESAQRGANYALSSYHFYDAWVAWLRGDYVRALQAAMRAYEFATALDYLFARATCALAVTSILWDSGRPSEARLWMDRARSYAEGDANLLLLYGCDLVEADALWDTDRDRALTVLRRGFTLAREHDYFSTFWVGTTMLSRLAARALEHGIEPDHVRALIVKRKLAPTSGTATVEGWHWPYRLRVLGALEIRRADQVLEGRAAPKNQPSTDPRGMPLRLLQATVALGGRGVPDTRIIDALWPDADGDSGRRVFDTTLHRLRRQLGDDAILRLIDGRLHIDERLCWVDLWAFEEALAKVKEAIAREASTSGLIALARQLLDLYRGPLLADIAGQHLFVRGPRSQWAAKFLHGAESLGKELEKRSQFDIAADLYRRAVEGDQGIELAYAGLIRCAFGAGRRTDGLRLFEQCRVRMRSDLGQEPGPELARLHARLIGTSP